MTSQKAYADGAPNEKGAATGVTLVSPQGHQLPNAIRSALPASNNIAEHGALLAGFRLASVFGAQKIEVCSYFLLAMNQISGEYQRKGQKMAAYVSLSRGLLQYFKGYQIRQVP